MTTHESFCSPFTVLVCVFQMNLPLLMESDSLTYLSAAMATRWSIDAVQQRTSHDVHISHSSGPSIQPSLICKHRCNKKWNAIYWKFHQSKCKSEPNKYNSIRLPECSDYKLLDTVTTKTKYTLRASKIKAVIHWFHISKNIEYIANLIWSTQCLCVCVCARAYVLKFKQSRK